MMMLSVAGLRCRPGCFCIERGRWNPRAFLQHAGRCMYSIALSVGGLGPRAPFIPVQVPPLYQLTKEVTHNRFCTCSGGGGGGAANAKHTITVSPLAHHAVAGPGQQHTDRHHPGSLAAAKKHYGASLLPVLCEALVCSGFACMQAVRDGLLTPFAGRCACLVLGVTG